MLIQAQGLTKYYGRTVGAEDLNFAVKEGEVFGFLGPNGAGKTTTIRLLMGFIRPTRGRADVFDMDAWSESIAIRDSVGFLPGEIHLYENMTCEALLMFMGRFRRGFDPKHMKTLAERFQMNLSVKVRGLSKGMKQKVGIIQAFMHDAPLLVLDEPSSGLDPLMQTEFVDLLREQKAAGKTIFLSSHMLNEVEKVCDRVAIIREGRLVAVGEIENLKQRRVRHLDVTFDHPLEPDRFQLPDVSIISAEGPHLHLSVKGRISPLLKAIADYEVLDMTLTAPDMEEVFLHYYNHQSGEETPSKSTKDTEKGEEK